MSEVTYHTTNGHRSIRAVILAFGFLAFTFSVKGQTPATANEVKAVFLYNFSRFVTWPPPTSNNSNSSFIIGILGNDPFGSFLESVVEGEKVDGRPIIIRRYGDAHDVKDCQILYINKRNASGIAKELQNRSILTVSDTDDFATDGGMIRFSFVNNKIRLQINAKTAKTANLTISSKLLRVAEVIDN